jgi:hypothetical protein
MKSVLARMAVQQGIGILADEHEVVLSQVAFTPVGPVEVARRREACPPDQLAAVLGRLLPPLLPRRGAFRTRVALGLPALRVFFSTRPIQTADADASPEVLLHEVLQSPSLNIDDMYVDMIRAQPGARPVASIVSCRRKYLAGQLAALEGCGVSPVRAEPAPCALLRVATHRHRGPRRSRAVLRVFLGESQGLAVLTAAKLPLMWRPFGLPAGGEEAAIRALVASLQVLGKFCGLDAGFDAVLIHGRPDLGPLFPPGSPPLGEDLKVARHDGPGLDPHEIAFGLALGCPPSVEGFNLARTLRPRASLWEIFPWGETMAQAGLLALATMPMLGHAGGLHREHRAVRAEFDRHAWAKDVPDEKLEKERKDLDQKVDAVRKFLDGRIAWTSYTHDIASRLPANLSMTSFQGLSELDLMKKGTVKKKKSLVLGLSAPIGAGGLVPPEVDDFLVSLRFNPLLKRAFPEIELGDLKWFQPSAGAQPFASFTVVCLPASAKAPAKPAKEAPKKGG